MASPDPNQYTPIIIPVKTGGEALAPPASPSAAFWARLRAGIAVLVPGFLTFILDPAVQLVSGMAGQPIQLPDQWRAYQPFVGLALSGGVAWYQSARKAAREHERQAVAQAMGLADASGRPTSQAVASVASSVTVGVSPQTAGPAGNAGPSGRGATNLYQARSPQNVAGSGGYTAPPVRPSGPPPSRRL